MSNQHPGTTTKRYRSSKAQQSNVPKPGTARKSPTVLRLEDEVTKLLQRLAEAESESEQLRDLLTDIRTIAHNKSTGPAVPDTYWEIRDLAGTDS